MTNINEYLNDGANWQAQAVLAFLRNNENYAVEKTWDKEYHKYDADIMVGRFENCREQGYIFSVKYKHQQRNYAVYEHRNLDAICVVVFDKLTINTPTLDDVCDAMGDDKYNYTKAFPYGNIVDCGYYIVSDMRAFIEDIEEKKKKED